MKLSMWILADWLKKYNPQIKIKDGRRTLRNVRLLSENVKMESMDVYMGAMKNFVDGNSAQVICVQGHDMILLDTEDTDQIFNEILDAFDYYNGWSDRLREMIRNGASLDDLLGSSYEIFGQKLIITDPGYLVIAHTNLEGGLPNKNLDAMKQTGIMPLKTIMAINNDPRIREKNPHSYIMDYGELGAPCFCRNLFSRNHHIGWVLVILEEHPATEGTKQLLDELGNIIEYWSDMHEDRLQLLSYTDIFQKILSGEEKDKRQQDTRLRSIGWYPEDEKQIYILNGVHTGANMQDFFHHKLERLADGCFTICWENKTALIVNRKIVLYRDFLLKLKDFMLQTKTYCGTSPEFTDILSLQEYFKMAEISAAYGDKTPGCINDFESCAVSYTIELIRNHAHVNISHPALSVLGRYDRKNHTELKKTLKEYLNCERNYVKTAARLYIHRNSLLYRLKRIEELTDIDLENEEIRLHLLLSYLIEERDVK